ncbi:MAG: NAD(P)/FAD-dependent oxidoreductase [Deltaproteobacteria bacterium]|nr:NAD(P)/FAD-dependent oxidoreductase [Deltaproteobacteria bacterium]
MKAPEHYLVVGGGPAGRYAALTLREKLPEARITLISQEPRPGYRPNLLPEFIAGGLSQDELTAQPVSLFTDREIKLRLGQKVAGLDLAGRQLVMEHKELITFTGLILAVGGRPRVPEPFWNFAGLMLPLKTLAQAQVWKDRLAGAQSVLLVGGDLTSFAFARALLKMGKQVFFVFTPEAFWPLRCRPEMVGHAARSLTGRGVEVVPGRLKLVYQSGGNRLTVMTDQVEVTVNLVGAFFGLVPDVGFLAGSGLRLERGVLVDQCLSTGAGPVYAAGDCAQVYHPDLRDYWVSIGHDNAVSLGRIAAENLAGACHQVDVPAKDIFCDEGVSANTSWWVEY